MIQKLCGIAFWMIAAVTLCAGGIVTASGVWGMQNGSVVDGALALILGVLLTAAVLLIVAAWVAMYAQARS